MLVIAADQALRDLGGSSPASRLLQCGVPSQDSISPAPCSRFRALPEASVGSGIRHQSPGFLGQGLEKLTLQLGIVAGQFDQALFQLAGFVLQSQL